MIYLQLFLSFLKIGAIAFGGGYGVVSLLQDEVARRGWLTSEEFLNYVAVSESTPGPIAINIATFVGSQQGGVLGAFLATLGVVLPAFLIILFIAAIMRNLLKYAGVNAFLEGIRPAVAALIVTTALLMLVTQFVGFSSVGDAFDFRWKNVVIFAVIVLAGFLYKKFLKKSIPPIVIVLVSAALGVVFFGLIR